MIRLVVDDDGQAVRLYRWKQLTDGRREYETYEGKTRTIRDGEQPPFCLALSGEEAKALASALADWTGEQLPDMGYLQGKLEVMEAYLADMRSIAIPESLQ
jgi:hypothetical protein